MIDGNAIRKLAFNVARYSGIAPLARPLFSGIGAILMLHRVTARPERPDGANRHLTIDPYFLDDLIGGMKRDGYDFVSMDEAVARIRDGGRDGRFATITADDAYRDNVTEALPVLERHKAPITIYAAPALISGTAYLWWDVVDAVVAVSPAVRLATPDGPVTLDASTPAAKHAAFARLHDHLTQSVPEELQREVVRGLAADAGIDPDLSRRRTIMSWDELRRAAAHPLVTIGAHTVNHYNLRRLGEDKARREIVDAARILAIELGQKPLHMAYPYGYERAVGCREVKLAAEAGFVTAVTTRHGVLQAAHVDHLLALPRISVNGNFQDLAHLRTMLSGLTTPLANRGRMVVTV